MKAAASNYSVKKLPAWTSNLTGAWFLSFLLSSHLLTSLLGCSLRYEGLIACSISVSTFWIPICFSIKSLFEALAGVMRLWPDRARRISLTCRSYQFPPSLRRPRSRALACWTFTRLIFPLFSFLTLISLLSFVYTPDHSHFSLSSRRKMVMLNLIDHGSFSLVLVLHLILNSVLFYTPSTLSCSSYLYFFLLFFLSPRYSFGLVLSPSVSLLLYRFY